MSRRTTWSIALVVVLVLFLLAGGPDIVIDTLENGPRIGPSTIEGNNGLIPDDPQELADAAGVDLGPYALARCLASEHPRDATTYLRCVAWAVRNKAAERGVSVFTLLTDGAGVAGDGYFGEQKAAAGTKYASTVDDPHRRHVQVAQEVMASPQAADLTGGCTHFFSPRAQDALAAKAQALKDRQDAGEELTAEEKPYLKYLGKDAAFTDANWRAQGLYPGGAERVVPPGIDSEILSLYRRLG